MSIWRGAIRLPGDGTITPLAVGTASTAPQPKQPIELPGISCFLRDSEVTFHTYSTFARGGEAVGGAHYFLDLTALGRQEGSEEPKGRATELGPEAGSDEILYPDQYEVAARS